MLRQDAAVRKIYCLVRADTAAAAYGRVSEALRTRGLPDLPELVLEYGRTGSVVCTPCDLSSSDLGMPEEIRQQLTQESMATILIHTAWTVNFCLGLPSFANHFRGMHNLLAFAMADGIHIVFISSTASVGRSSGCSVPEMVSPDPSDASPMGYARSKWVAEKICLAAHEHLANSHKGAPDQQHRISVIRVGQLCGSNTGVWNSNEAYPLMLSTAAITGCLPFLQDEVLHWLLSTSPPVLFWT
jgi:thioester reductase-like protein